MGKIEDFCCDLKFALQCIKSTKSLPMKKKILKYLKNKDDDWCTSEEIANSLNLNEGKIIKILYKLEMEGIIIDETYDIDKAYKFAIFRIVDRRLL